MSHVSQCERAIQNYLVQFFQTDLGYRYLGDWQDRANNNNIEVDILVYWYKKMRRQRGVDQSCYWSIGYGSSAGHLNETVWLIDWKNPEANDFISPRSC